MLFSLFSFLKTHQRGYIFITTLVIFTKYLFATLITPTTPFTTIDKSESGTTLYYIAESDENFLSYNTFSDFHVDEGGLVINNAIKETNSQLLGPSNPNPFLQGRAAQFIIFDIHAQNSSTLAGPSEILGQKADLILCNPWGFNINGAQFLNARKIMLQATPYHSSSFAAPSSQIHVGEKGLFSSSDAMELSAAILKIEGWISASNDLRLKSQTYQNLDKQNTNQNPGIIIDPTAVIEAGAIEIIATGDGFGVNSQGVIHSHSDLKINSETDIMASYLITKEKLLLKSRGRIHLNGKATQPGLISGKSIKLDSQKLQIIKDISMQAEDIGIYAENKSITLDNSDSHANQLNLISPDAVTIKSCTFNIQKNINITGKKNLSIHDSLVMTEHLHKNSPNISALQTKIHTEKLTFAHELHDLEKLVLSSNIQLKTDLNLSAKEIVLAGTIYSPSMISLTADRLTHNAVLISDQQITSSANIFTDFGFNEANEIEINAKEFKQYGTLKASKNIVLNIQEHIQKGHILSHETIHHHGRNLSNHGLIEAGTRLDISSNILLNQGLLISEDLLSIQTTSLINRGQFEAPNLRILTHDFINTGNILIDHFATIHSFDFLQKGFIQAQNLKLILKNKLFNQGHLAVSNHLIIHGQDISQEGLIKSFSLDLTSPKLDNKGVISITTNSDLTIENFKNQGLFESQENIDLKLKNLINKGQLISADKLHIEAPHIEQHGLLKAHTLALYTPSLFHQQGVINSYKNISIHSPEVLQEGLLSSGGTVTINAKKLKQNGLIQASNNIVLNIQDLTQHGHILSEKKIYHPGKNLFNQGLIEARTHLNISANILHNQGLLISKDACTLNVASLINEGQLKAPHFNILSNSLINTGNILSEQFAVIQSQEFLQNGIIQTQKLNLFLNNGFINRGPIISKYLYFHGPSFQNFSNIELGKASIDSALLENQGHLTMNSLDLIHTTHFKNSGSFMIHKDLSLQNLNFEQSGFLGVGGYLNIQQNHLFLKGHLHVGATLNIACKILEQQGIVSAASLNLQGQTVMNDGQILQHNSGTISLQTLINKGEIMTQDDLKIETHAFINEGKLLISDLGHLQLTTTELDNSKGTIFSEGDLSLFINNPYQLNTNLLALKNLYIQADAIQNSDNFHTQSNVVLLTKKGDFNNQGQLILDQNLSIQSANNITNQGLILSNGRLDFSVTNDLTNDGHILSTAGQSIDAQTLKNNGKIESYKNIFINTTDLNNHNSISSLETVAISAKKAVNENASITASTLNIKSDHFLNTGLLQSLGNISFLINELQNGQHQFKFEKNNNYIGHGFIPVIKEEAYRYKVKEWKSGPWYARKINKQWIEGHRYVDISDENFQEKILTYWDKIIFHHKGSILAQGAIKIEGEKVLNIGSEILSEGSIEIKSKLYNQSLEDKKFYVLNTIQKKAGYSGVRFSEFTHEKQYYKAGKILRKEKKFNHRSEDGLTGMWTKKTQYISEVINRIDAYVQSRTFLSLKDTYNTFNNRHDGQLIRPFGQTSELHFYDSFLASGFSKFKEKLKTSASDQQTKISNAQMAATDILIQGELNNKSVIQAKKGLHVFDADFINNQGNLNAKQITLESLKNLYLSGQIDAKDHLWAKSLGEFTINGNIQSHGWVSLESNEALSIHHNDLLSDHPQFKVINQLLIKSQKDLLIQGQLLRSGFDEQKKQFDVGDLLLESAENLTLQHSQIKAKSMAIYTKGELAIHDEGSSQIQEVLLHDVSFNPLRARSFFEIKNDLILSSEQHIIIDKSQLTAKDIFIESQQDTLLTMNDFSSQGDLSIFSGGDLKLSSVSRETTHANGWDTQFFTNSLNAGGNLVLSSQGDLLIEGGQFSSGKSTFFESQGQLEWTGLLQKSQLKTPKKTTNQTRVIESSLQSNENIYLLSQDFLRLKSIHLEAKEHLQLYAEKNLDLLTLSEIRSSQETHHQKGNFFNEDISTTQTLFTQKNKATKLKSGGNLAIHAGTNLWIKGAEIHSQGHLSLRASGSVLIEALRNIRQETTITNSDHWTGSRLLINAYQTESIKETQLHSLGDLEIASADTMTLAGSQLFSKGNLSLISKRDILCHAVLDRYSQWSYEHHNVWGLYDYEGDDYYLNEKFTLSEKASDGDLTMIASNNINLKGMHAFAKGDLTLSAGKFISIESLTSKQKTIRNRSKQQFDGFYLALKDNQIKNGLSFEKKEDSFIEESLFQLQSQLISQSNLKLNSNKNIHLIGALLNSQDNLELHAAHQIKLLPAYQQQQRIQRNSQNKFYIGTAIGNHYVDLAAKTYDTVQSQEGGPKQLDNEAALSQETQALRQFSHLLTNISKLNGLAMQSSELMHNAARSASTAATFGFYGALESQVSHHSEESTEIYTYALGNRLHSHAGNISVQSKHRLQSYGSHILAEHGNIHIKAKSYTFEGAKDTSRNDQSSNAYQIHTRIDTSGLISSDLSYQEHKMTHIKNIEIQGFIHAKKGHLMIENEDDSSLINQDIQAEHIVLNSQDADLIIASMQSNSFKEQHQLTFSAGLNNQGSSTFQYGHQTSGHDENWVTTQSRIIASDGLAIKAKGLTITGALIANADVTDTAQLGRDKGNLHIEIDRLQLNAFEDDRNDYQKGFSIGMNNSLGTFGLNDYDVNKQQQTRAVIGQGIIKVNGKAWQGQSHERQLQKSQIISEHQEHGLGELNFSFEFDSKKRQAQWKKLTSLPQNSRLAWKRHEDALVDLKTALTLYDRTLTQKLELRREQIIRRETLAQLSTMQLAILHHPQAFSDEAKLALIEAYHTIEARQRGTSPGQAYLFDASSLDVSLALNNNAKSIKEMVAFSSIKDQKFLRFYEANHLQNSHLFIEALGHESQRIQQLKQGVIKDPTRLNAWQNQAIQAGYHNKKALSRELSYRLDAVPLPQINTPKHNHHLRERGNTIALDQTVILPKLYAYQNRILFSDGVPDRQLLILDDDSFQRYERRLVKNLISGDFYSPMPISILDPLVTFNDFRGNLYDFNNANDVAQIQQRSDMKYIIKKNSAIIFQNGMNNQLNDAQENVSLIESIRNEAVSLIHNPSHGLINDVLEYLGPYTLKDALNAHFYEQLAKEPHKSHIVAFSAGNEDAYRAMTILAKERRPLTPEKVHFISVGSPRSSQSLAKASTAAGVTFLGQHNDWRDPVTRPKTWISSTILAGPTAGVFGALTGVIVGGIAAGTSGTSLLQYHSFKDYLDHDINSLKAKIEDI